MEIHFLAIVSCNVRLTRMDIKDIVLKIVPLIFLSFKPKESVLMHVLFLIIPMRGVMELKSVNLFVATV